MIPIATEKVQLVAMEPVLEQRRVDDTATTGEPTILGYDANKDRDLLANQNLTGLNKYPETQRSLYYQLKEQWKGVWVYKDPNGKEKDVEIDADWYNPYEDTNSTTWDGYVKRAFADFDFDDIEDPEKRTCEITFKAPPSLGPSEDEELEFSYWVRP